jgi:hypothetical protein
MFEKLEPRDRKYLKFDMVQTQRSTFIIGKSVMIMKLHVECLDYTMYHVVSELSQKNGNKILVNNYIIAVLLKY